jgi:hypothetical protein
MAELTRMANDAQALSAGRGYHRSPAGVLLGERLAARRERAARDGSNSLSGQPILLHPT